jgi:hypothetical protein
LFHVSTRGQRIFRPELFEPAPATLAVELRHAGSMEDEAPRDITLEVGEVMDKFIEELAELKVRSHKLEVLAATQAEGLRIIGAGLVAQGRFIEAIIPHLDQILGQQAAAEVRAAVADVDELRRMYGTPDPPAEK